MERCEIKIVSVGGGRIGCAIVQQFTKEGHDIALADSRPVWGEEETITQKVDII